MNEKQVKDAMEEIRLSAAKKEELWETIAKQRVYQKNKRRKRAVAAAASHFHFVSHSDRSLCGGTVFVDLGKGSAEEWAAG